MLSKKEIDDIWDIPIISNYSQEKAEAFIKDCIRRIEKSIYGRRPKFIKCVECGQIINVSENQNFSCNCNRIVILEGTIKGIAGTDYIDVSPQLLNEGTV